MSTRYFIGGAVVMVAVIVVCIFSWKHGQSEQVRRNAFAKECNSRGGIATDDSYMLQCIGATR